MTQFFKKIATQLGNPPDVLNKSMTIGEWLHETLTDVIQMEDLTESYKWGNIKYQIENDASSKIAQWISKYININYDYENNIKYITINKYFVLLELFNYKHKYWLKHPEYCDKKKRNNVVCPNVSFDIYKTSKDYQLFSKKIHSKIAILSAEEQGRKDFYNDTGINWLDVEEKYANKKISKKDITNYNKLKNTKNRYVSYYLKRQKYDANYAYNDLNYVYFTVKNLKMPNI